MVALGVPTEREKTQWYFQRYAPHLPAAEMVLFDRSSYNRAGVERVMGFCSDAEYSEFLRSCPEFERMLVRSGIQVIKYWFSVSPEEQERRLRQRIEDPVRRRKISPMDVKSRELWEEYSKAKDEMFAYTDIKQAPWFVVPSDDKKRARLNCIAHLLSQIPYHNVKVEKLASSHGVAKAQDQRAPTHGRPGDRAPGLVSRRLEEPLSGCFRIVSASGRGDTNPLNLSTVGSACPGSAS